MKSLWLVVVAAFIIFAGLVYVVSGSIFAVTDPHTAYANGNIRIPANGTQIQQTADSINPGPEDAWLRVVNIDPGYDFYGLSETATGTVTLLNPTDHYVNSSDVYLTVKKQEPSTQSGLLNYKTILYSQIHFDDQIPPGTYVKQFTYEVPKQLNGEDALGFWTIDADLSVNNLTYTAVHIEYNIVPAVDHI